jgi:hypothetical protein
MSKRLFIIVAAVAAFAVMPVAAQAAAGEAHWAANGSLIKEGVKTPIINWGGATNLSQTSKIGEINCKGIGSGYVENPVGGTAGVGKSQQSVFYECKSAGCEEAAKLNGIPLTSYTTTNAGYYSFGASGDNASFGLAGQEGWRNHLNEVSPTNVEEEIGVEWGGTFTTYPKPLASEETEALVTCETPPGFSPHIVGISASFQGMLHPSAIGTGLEGTSGCNKPSQVEFKGAASGALHSEVGVEGSNSGKVKICGYTAQALITVVP